MDISSRTDPEREDLVEALGAHRAFLLATVRGLDDEQAARRTTVSELCLGGLVKQVAVTESQWVDFVLEGARAMAVGPAEQTEHENSFRLLDGETLDGVVTMYEQVARRTDELVRTIPDLDVSHELPEAPWFPQGARRSARRVFLHIIGETAQHAGHADILREALDGQKTMG